MTKTGEGRGNDGLWKARKTKNGFPSLPTALGNRCAIPTFPPPRRRTQMEKWKSKSRIPTFPLHGFPLPNSFRKEAELRIASLPPSGSSFDEKMLCPACQDRGQSSGRDKKPGSIKYFGSPVRSPCHP